MRRRMTVCLGLALVVACSDDSTSATGDSVGDEVDATGDEASTGETTTVGEGDTTTFGTTTDGDGDGDTSGDGDGDWPVFTPFAESDWARGDISIARVEVNQGIAIPIVLAGTLIPVEERTAPLVKDRNTLVQVFWSVPGNWQARPIKAKLHLRNGQGQLGVLEVTKTISGEPTSGSLNGAITFQVPAAVFVGDLQFFIELWEGEPGHDDIPASSQAPSAPGGGGAPGTGMQPIGVTSEPMEAKIVMVPVQYDYGNCHTDTTSVLNDNLQGFADHFFAQNPIHTLHIEIRPEKLIRDTQVTTLTQITTSLAGLRYADFAEPNEYYFALLDACTGGIDGAGGISPGTPGPLKGLGDLRVSVGLLAGVEWSKGTFVHELGHNQGRPHSPCGDPDGPDPNYPHGGASIGVYGFHILTGQFYGPGNHKDYMSYCDPVWASDWTWDWVHEQVRQLTSWDYADSHDDPFVEVLHGWVHPSGEQAWWTSPGELPDEMLTTAESVAFYDDEGVLIDHRPAASWTLPDGKTQYFMAEVPDSDLELVGDVVRISKDVETTVPRHAITRRFDD